MQRLSKASAALPADAPPADFDRVCDWRLKRGQRQSGKGRLCASRASVGRL